MCVELEECGFETDGVNNSLEALDLAGRNEYICAIVDINIPGINRIGREDSLAKIFNTPTIIISGLGDISFRRIFSSGASMYFPKPLNFKRLTDVLNYNFTELSHPGSKRRHARLSLINQDKVIFESPTLDVEQLYDISVNGIKFEVANGFSKFEKEMEFTLKVQNRNLNGTGNVVWEKLLGDKYYVGVRFTDNTIKSFRQSLYFCQIFCITPDSLGETLLLL